MVIESIYRHFSRWAHLYLWVLVAFVALGRYFLITVNVSDSLPGKVFLVVKGSKPEKGGLVAFRYHQNWPYSRDSLFLKIVAGAPGSIVWQRDVGGGFHDYYVDGRFVGRAKPFSKMHVALKPGPTGVLPPARYYVMAPHPDSLDSRYELVGWVHESEIVGRAYRVF